jgi:hypothetical protein
MLSEADDQRLFFRFSAAGFWQAGQTPESWSE